MTLVPNIPLNSRLRVDYYPFKPTGQGSIDTPELKRAVDGINAYQNGDPTKMAVIEIEDNAHDLTLDGNYLTNQLLSLGNGQILIQGQTRNAGIHNVNPVYVEHGNYANIFADSSAGTDAVVGTWDGATANSGSITNSSVTLAAGDYVLLWSEDTLPGAEPHLAGGANHPAEIHRIEYVSGSTAYLCTPTIDTMTVGNLPRIAKLKMLRGCGFRNLRWTSAIDNQSVDVQTRALYSRRMIDYIFEDVRFDGRGPGFLFLDTVYNARIAGFVVDRQPNTWDDYGIAAGITHGLDVVHSKFNGVRHAFTTGGVTLNASSYTDAGAWSNVTAYTVNQRVSYLGSYYRCRVNNTNQTPTNRTYWQQLDSIYSTPAYSYIHHSEATYAGDGTHSLSVFDCHASGYRNRFHDLAVYMTNPGRASIAFTSRARETQFHRCYATGCNSYDGVGFDPVGQGTEIYDCSVEHMLYGVRFQAGQGNGYFGDHVVRSTRFNDLWGPAVFLSAPVTNVLVEDCKIKNVGHGNSGGTVGSSAGRTLQRAPIITFGGAGLKVRSCQLDKYGGGGPGSTAGNTFSLQAGTSANGGTDVTGDMVEMSGNWCRGYGSGSLGVNGGGGSPTIETKWTSDNYIDA